jgi:hypothetical protein
MLQLIVLFDPGNGNVTCMTCFVLVFLTFYGFYPNIIFFFRFYLTIINIIKVFIIQSDLVMLDVMYQKSICQIKRKSK